MLLKAADLADVLALMFMMSKIGAESLVSSRHLALKLVKR